MEEPKSYEVYHANGNVVPGCIYDATTHKFLPREEANHSKYEDIQSIEITCWDTELMERLMKRDSFENEIWVKDYQRGKCVDALMVKGIKVLEKRGLSIPQDRDVHRVISVKYKTYVDVLLLFSKKLSKAIVNEFKQCLTKSVYNSEHQSYVKFPEEITKCFAFSYIYHTRSSPGKFESSAMHTIRELCRILAYSEVNCIPVSAWIRPPTKIPTPTSVTSNSTATEQPEGMSTPSSYKKTATTVGDIASVHIQGIESQAVIQQENATAGRGKGHGKPENSYIQDTGSYSYAGRGFGTMAGRGRSISSNITKSVVGKTRVTQDIKESYVRNQVENLEYKIANNLQFEDLSRNTESRDGSNINSSQAQKFTSSSTIDNAPANVFSQEKQNPMGDGFEQKKDFSNSDQNVCFKNSHISENNAMNQENRESTCRYQPTLENTYLSDFDPLKDMTPDSWYTKQKASLTEKYVEDQKQCITQKPECDIVKQSTTSKNPTNVCSKESAEEKVQICNVSNSNEIKYRGSGEKKSNIQEFQSESNDEWDKKEQKQPHSTKLTEKQNCDGKTLVSSTQGLQTAQHSNQLSNGELETASDVIHGSRTTRGNKVLEQNLKSGVGNKRNSTEDKKCDLSGKNLQNQKKICKGLKDSEDEDEKILKRNKGKNCSKEKKETNKGLRNLEDEVEKILKPNKGQNHLKEKKGANKGLWDLEDEDDKILKPNKGQNHLKEKKEAKKEMKSTLMQPVKVEDDPCGFHHKYYGTDNSKHQPKVILFLGASGSGKTTLINFVANYCKGKKTADEELIHVEPTSPTSTITAYTFCEDADDVPITIIDTPGLNDASGAEIRDHVQTLKTFLANASSKGYTIHAIGFVAQAYLVRLTSSERLVMDYVSNIFGQSVADHLITFVTFADNQNTPPVVEAMRNYGVKFKVSLNFNNSALHNSKSDDVEDLDRVYFRVCRKNWKKCLKILNDLSPLSVNAMKAVQNEIYASTVVKSAERDLHAEIASFFAYLKNGEYLSKKGIKVCDQIWNLSVIIHHHNLEQDKLNANSTPENIVTEFAKEICKTQTLNPDHYICYLSLHHTKPLVVSGVQTIRNMASLYKEALDLSRNSLVCRNITEWSFCHQCQKPHKMTRCEPSFISRMLKGKNSEVVALKCATCPCPGECHGVSELQSPLHLNKILEITLKSLRKTIHDFSLPSFPVPESVFVKHLREVCHHEHQEFFNALCGVMK